MIIFIKSLLRKSFFPNRRYFQEVDWGTTDRSVIVEGYEDDKGVIHITKTKVLD